VEWLARKLLRISPHIQKKSCMVSCQVQDIHMTTHWIPRNQRWTNEERKQKEITARNNRQLNRMFWNELNTIRAQIELEIEPIRAAKIKSLE